MLFYIISSAIVLTALLVIFSRNTMHAALWLAASLFAQAVLFVTMNAHLVAILQVLIYAGAVVVLIIFVIMMLNLSPKSLKWRTLTGGRLIVASGAIYLAAVMGIVAWIISKQWTVNSEQVVEGQLQGTIENVGELLVTKYAVPFELLGVLLLVAVVGAVVTVRKVKI